MHIVLTEREIDGKYDESTQDIVFDALYNRKRWVTRPPTEILMRVGEELERFAKNQWKMINPKVLIEIDWMKK